MLVAVVLNLLFVNYNARRAGVRTLYSFKGGGLILKGSLLSSTDKYWYSYKCDFGHISMFMWELLNFKARSYTIHGMMAVVKSCGILPLQDTTLVYSWVSGHQDTPGSPPRRALVLWLYKYQKEQAYWSFLGNLLVRQKRSSSSSNRSSSSGSNKLVM